MTFLKRFMHHEKKCLGHLQSQETNVVRPFFLPLLNPMSENMLRKEQLTETLDQVAVSI